MAEIRAEHDGSACEPPLRLWTSYWVLWLVLLGLAAGGLLLSLGTTTALANGIVLLAIVILTLVRSLAAPVVSVERAGLVFRPHFLRRNRRVPFDAIARLREEERSVRLVLRDGTRDRFVVSFLGDEDRERLRAALREALPERRLALRAPPSAAEHEQRFGLVVLFVGLTIACAFLVVDVPFGP